MIIPWKNKCLVTAFTYSKLTIERLGQGVKYVYKVNNKDIRIQNWTALKTFKDHAPNQWKGHAKYHLAELFTHCIIVVNDNVKCLLHAPDLQPCTFFSVFTSISSASIPSEISWNADVAYSRWRWQFKVPMWCPIERNIAAMFRKMHWKKQQCCKSETWKILTYVLIYLLCF